MPCRFGTNVSEPPVEFETLVDVVMADTGPPRINAVAGNG